MTAGKGRGPVFHGTSSNPSPAGSVIIFVASAALSSACDSSCANAATRSAVDRLNEQYVIWGASASVAASTQPSGATTGTTVVDNLLARAGLTISASANALC